MRQPCIATFRHPAKGTRLMNRLPIGVGNVDVDKRCALYEIMAAFRAISGSVIPFRRPANSRSVTAILLPRGGTLDRRSRASAYYPRRPSAGSPKTTERAPRWPGVHGQAPRQTVDVSTPPFRQSRSPHGLDGQEEPRRGLADASRLPVALATILGDLMTQPPVLPCVSSRSVSLRERRRA
jgi:hypothetical protein